MGHTIFRTTFEIPKYPLKISRHSKITAIGSCFAEHMGSKLAASKFDVLVNPFGIMFNPLSVSEVLSFGMGEKSLDDLQVVHQDGLYHSLSHHGRFSANTKGALMANISAELDPFVRCLTKSNVILLTFGSAYIFEYIASRTTVANCHKLPAYQFFRRRLSVEEIILNLSEVLRKLFSKSDDAQILLSVSPVRHWRDGAHENQLSKSVLHLAVEALVATFENCHYFPSYELLMDDLRDYRFYAEDMLHPNAQAIDYIHGHFANTLLDAEAKQFEERMHKLRLALDHKPLHPQSKVHHKFLLHTKSMLHQLRNDYPELDFDQEAKILQQRFTIAGL